MFNPNQIDEALENIDANCRRKLPQLERGQERSGTFVIVGSSPSLADFEVDLRRAWAQSKNRVVALNAAHDWMIDRKMVPWGFCAMEVAEWPERFLAKPHKRVTYMLASMCAQSSYERLKGNKLLQWHAWEEIGEKEVIERYYPDPVMVGGGGRAALRAIAIGLWMGYRDFEIYGVDSSFEDQSHVDSDETEYHDQPMVARYNGKEFRSNKSLLKQATDFEEFCETWHGMFTMRVYGYGLMPWMHQSKYPHQYPTTSFYNGDKAYTNGRHLSVNGERVAWIERRNVS